MVVNAWHWMKCYCAFKDLMLLGVNKLNVLFASTIAVLLLKYANSTELPPCIMFDETFN